MAGASTQVLAHQKLKGREGARIRELKSSMEGMGTRASVFWRQAVKSAVEAGSSDEMRDEGVSEAEAVYSSDD